MNTRTVLTASIIAALSFAPQITLAGHDDATTAAATDEQLEVRVKDAWLDGKLETALLFNEHLNSFRINTDVKNGVAYLSGAVESDIDRDLAGEIAKSIDGITSVDNELVIDKRKAEELEKSNAMAEERSFKQRIDDATLTATVKSQLLFNENTGGLSIDVDSANAVVTLSGEVDSRQERDLAERIAMNTEGVVDVDNRLVVESSSNS